MAEPRTPVHVVFRWEMTDQRLKLVLAYIELAWPQCKITIDPRKWNHEPINCVPSSFDVHATQKVLDECTAAGVTEETECLVVHLDVEAYGIEFIVGPEGSVGESLMHGITNTLRANWEIP